jgi:hypothetical protein
MRETPLHHHSIFDNDYFLFLQSFAIFQDHAEQIFSGGECVQTDLHSMTGWGQGFLKAFGFDQNVKISKARA